MTLLSSLRPGESAVITCLPFDVKLASRLREMGLLIGTRIAFVRAAPLGDPLEFRLRGFDLSIRRGDAAQVLIDETTLILGEVAPVEALEMLEKVIPRKEEYTQVFLAPDHPPGEVYAKSDFA